MKALLYFIALGSLTACSVTKNWKSNVAPSHIYGSFDYLNGTQTLSLKVPSDKSILKYTLKNVSGNFRLVIKSTRNVVVDTIVSKDISGTITLSPVEDVEYKVRLTGKGAGGSYDIECLSE